MGNNHTKLGFHNMRTIFFFGLIILLGIALLYLLRPFFYPIFWAAIIAVLFHPVYAFINHHLKFPSISSFICLILVLAIIFLPLTIVAIMLVNQSVHLYNSLVSGGGIPSVQGVTTFVQQSFLAPYFATIQETWTTYAANATKTLSGLVFSNVKSITQNSVRFFFQLFILFYTLYYFFKDGEHMLKRLMHLSPLGEQYERMLYERFRSTSSATLKSSFVVGGVQGILGGLLFWITGIQGAFVWGVLMTVLAMIPAVGTVLVWLPAGLIMLALGNVWQGLTVLIVGALVISTIDNIIRPPLVGKGAQMHPMMVLFSTLGGIFLFGVSGFVIGPIIAALFLSVMSIYEYYYKNELTHN